MDNEFVVGIGNDKCLYRLPLRESGARWDRAGLAHWRAPAIDTGRLFILPEPRSQRQVLVLQRNGAMAVC